jgi:hypothetical protein
VETSLVTDAFTAMKRFEGKKQNTFFLGPNAQKTSLWQENHLSVLVCSSNSQRSKSHAPCYFPNNINHLSA